MLAGFSVTFTIIWSPWPFPKPQRSSHWTEPRQERFIGNSLKNHFCNHDGFFSAKGAQKYSFKVIIRHNLLIDTTAYRTQNHGLCLVIAKFRLLFTGPKLLIRHKKSGNNWLIETNG